MRRLAAILTLLAALLLPALAAAQAPAPVPALPDTERLTSYAIVAGTGPYSVGFALYGDGTDYGNWVQVFLCTSATLNPCSQLTPVTAWTLSSPSGSLGSLPLPITDATVTLTAPHTGTLYIVGARRPRRLSQFTENRGVAARDLNQIITDLVASSRERWDQVLSAVRGEPQEVLSALQPATTRAGGIFCWDATGLIPQTCAPSSSGGSGIVGPNVSVAGHLATWGNTTGTLLADSGAAPVLGPGSSTVGDAVVWNNTGGSLTKDVPFLQVYGTIANNSFLGGPSTGGPSFPTFRTLTAADIAAPLAATKLPTTQKLTTGTGATYTTGSGALWIEVSMVGGGGGGSGSSSSAIVAGTAGGTSTFNSINAAGGGVGNTAGSGGAGGTGGTGTARRQPGGNGTPGIYGTSGDVFMMGGGGGTSYFGGGGTGTTATGAGNAAAANTGAGGGGTTITNTGESGGGGGAGEFVYLLIQNPSATYTYTIGAGGAGGSSTETGGAGGSGFIFVLEHYAP